MDSKLRELERAHLQGDEDAHYQYEARWRRLFTPRGKVHFIVHFFHSRVGLAEKLKFSYKKGNNMYQCGPTVSPDHPCRSIVCQIDGTHKILTRCGKHINIYQILSGIKPLHHTKHEDFITCKSCRKSVEGLKRDYDRRRFKSLTDFIEYLKEIQF